MNKWGPRHGGQWFRLIQTKEEGEEEEEWLAEEEVEEEEVETEEPEEEPDVVRDLLSTPSTTERILFYNR
jgi:hypothetical protein